MGFKKSYPLFLLLLLFFFFYSERDLHAASDPIYENAVAVLIYHHIDPNESAITVSPQRFKEHMDALRDQGYHVISLQEYENFVKYNTPVPSNAVLITFDDGYESVYKYAYPILLDHGFTATTFIIVKDSENPGGNPRLPFLNFDEMREMQQKGMTFQSHSYNQHYADHLLMGPIYSFQKQDMETVEEYEKRVTSDLLLAKQKLEKELGTKQNMLAFPHGEYNDRLIELGRQVGIDLFFTGDYGLSTSGNDRINRIQAGVPYVDGSNLVNMIRKATRMANPKKSFPFLPPKIKVNGIPLDNQLEQVRHGLSMMPLRPMAKLFGATVKWDAASQTISVMKNNHMLSLHEGSNQVEVNGKTEFLDVPIRLERNYVMVPVRWFSEAMGGKIEWSQSDNTVLITTEGDSVTE